MHPQQDLEAERTAGRTTGPPVPVQRPCGCSTHPATWQRPNQRQVHFPWWQGGRTRKENALAGASCGPSGAFPGCQQTPPCSLPRLPAHTPLKFGVRPRELERQYCMCRTGKVQTTTAFLKQWCGLTMAGSKRPALVRNHTSEERQGTTVAIIQKHVCARVCADLIWRWFGGP